MYVNERDQINYHGFLRSARVKSGASQSQVAKGLYTSSSYNRAELGVRVAEKTMRDRLTSRMGFSGERYVEYLGQAELQQWQLRKRIVRAIAEKDIETAETVYIELEKITDKDNSVQVQFIKSMHFFLLKLRDASKEELFASVREAVACTVKNIDQALVGKHLLADQELDLIAEYMSLQPYVGNPTNEHTWRILEYQKLITYMNTAKMEDLLKVKVYPKVTYLICQSLLKEEVPLYKLHDALQLCDKSLKLLEDTHRLYYFIEIQECKKEILYCMQQLEENETEKVRIWTTWKECAQKEVEWKDYYESAGISPYMEDSTYLYWENECHGAVEVIENRRKMFRIPRATLCEGICTERSLIRIERDHHNPSMFILNSLFERMGLCAEYRRGQIVCTDTEVLGIYENLIRSVNVFCADESKRYLGELKKGLCMDLAFNQQEVKRIEAVCANKAEICQLEDLYKQTVEALEYTMPIWALYPHKHDATAYYTRSELACIYDLAFMVHGEHSERCVEIIKEYCQKEIEEGMQPEKLGVLEFLLNGLISYLETTGEQEKAEALQKELIDTCLFYKRMPYVLTHEENVNPMWIE